LFPQMRASPAKKQARKSHRLIRRQRQPSAHRRETRAEAEAEENILFSALCVLRQFGYMSCLGGGLPVRCSGCLESLVVTL
jgi:hypothetical protein